MQTKRRQIRRSRRSGCPIAFGLDVFGDRWTLLVLRDVFFEGKTRFQEFLGSEERIASNILAARLEQLAGSGLLTKSPDPDDRRRFVYHPTSKGLDLVRVMLEIVRWSAKHDPETAAPPDFVAAVKRDREGVERMVRARFEVPAPPSAVVHALKRSTRK